MNYFDSQPAAERYSNGRPKFQLNTIKYIKDYLQINGGFDNALDIACGTGHSSIALLEMAKHVYGTDSSQEMLNQALRPDRINYMLALSGKQPFDDYFFDVITVCSAIHWFDIDAFLVEANRLLKSKSWLIIYDNYFISEMEGNEHFNNWFPDVFLKQFPSPPRNNRYDWSPENLLSKNFDMVHETKFKNGITFNKEQLIHYFTTMSNVISAVENELATYTEVEKWLGDKLAPFFDNDTDIRTINYENSIKIIQKAT